MDYYRASTKYLASYVIFTFLLLFELNAQDYNDTSSATIDVFLDCRGDCYETYLRDEITFVNYVRDKEDADVHIIITIEETASGGDEFKIRFLGKNDLSEESKTLKYYSIESDTEDKVRNGLITYIKMGLFSYLAKMPIADRLSFNISYDETKDDIKSVSDTDKWEKWVFEISAETEFEGEEQESELDLEGRINARRITSEWKMEFEIDEEIKRETFEEEDTTEVFIKESREADGLIVKSLGKHWSIGTSYRVRTSTFENMDLLVEMSPAIEYSIFPYKEFTEREITILYRLTTGFYDYDERTIFNKTSERLTKQQLSTNVRFTQPWGEFNAEINGIVHLRDFNENRLDSDLELSFRIFKGLSIFISAEYSLINNQISVPAGDITDAEKLLDLRERLTSHSYELGFGLKYSFGSIYNNTVNPRF